MRKKGFTLIELLVVISIISLLSSIVMASLSSARQKAQETALIAQAQEMMKIIEGALNNQSDYSAWLAAWAGYFGDQDCDNPPSFLNTTDRASMTKACHALFKVGIISPLNSGVPTQPTLISIQQRLTAWPSQRGYPNAYGITMYTLSNRMICVGSAGVYAGTYDLGAPNTSCYYAPPPVAP